MNMYTYCGNNPLKYTDPLGLKKNRGIAYAYIDIKTDDGKNNSYKIWNAGEIVDIVNQVAESDKKITYFRYIGHGDEEGGIYWSDSSGLETGLMVRRESWFSDDMYAMDDPDIKDAISRGFSPNAHIDIEACWSAQKGNICESFSDLLPEADVWGYIGKGKYAPGLKMIFPKYWDGARHVRFSKKGCK